jgi:hypothetical protein
MALNIFEVPMKCPFAEFNSKLLLMEGRFLLAGIVVGAVFSGPSVSYDIKIKAICSLGQ